MAVKPTKRGGPKRLAVALLAGASVLLVPLSTAHADDDDGERYPPKATTATTAKPRPARPIPATGNDGTDVLLKMGAGALVAGGILVTATVRRRAVSA